MTLIASDQFRIVVGLGKTGLSCVRHLARKGVPFAVVDSRENPPGLDELRALCPEVELRCGPLDGEFLSRADELILSPGVAQSEPAIRQAVAAGAALSGDIDLFCREVSAPIVAITGSNAKSTVTTLVGEMARAAGIDVGVGGNLGLPVLDMLAQGEQALYVLELSSFQLETCNDLRAAVATVLNVSPDHMDRYDDLQGYYQAKHRIYRGCRHAVANRQDPLSAPLLPMGVPQSSFGLDKPDLKQFGIIDQHGERWLAQGLEPWLPVSALKVRGDHNVANALAALALGSVVGLPKEAMLQALRDFAGLEHRCQWLREHNGVSYFNDSKGTNVGATVAALDGLGPTLPQDGKILLIAGGDGKGADFAELDAPLRRYGRVAVLIGRDAPRIRQALSIECVDAGDMAEAVAQAASLAKPGDIVLLSPACASFDMFNSFNHRGEVFMQQVEAL
ncbi:UDP-N-acetylmuramoyl-L-alanine--D-glutamate ligase [Marinobacterium arenosum]|uniref:UDP-N-acetylmuramoyl-L-alanine--D-glutamate ligase n=1 Tax=Marinobacterium arenosum TaxID=2862496 RepID=UPI001C953499|nr:UDP-N-acetylmuramoyl-L-alanine--D-glutamate ligase [Marinobacterium arenosum]MBY4676600.1 UDP-N-acetylmuramoyl-L-alanine--D-glutamate ligase [Marinobacterium arenosum]